MAVEASFPTNFPPEILMNKGNLMDSNGNIHMYGTGSGSVRYRILSGGGESWTMKNTEVLTPICVSGVDDFIPLKDAVKSESGLSHVGRKRSRDDDINNYYPGLSSRVNHTACFQNMQKNENSLFQNQQLEQLEINCLISQHMQNMRMEIEEKRQNYSRGILTAVEHNIFKKLIVKEEEIQKINKLNSFLDERVHSLNIDNQIWRELAQSNEATANALRSNLEEALTLAQVGVRTTALIDEEVKSCCDSNYAGGDNDDGGAISNRRCLNCLKEEASCLFLPCRHLCLCNACGPIAERCPFCNSAKNGCIQVVL